MGVAEQMCDRIFMIFKGRKVLDGTLDEIQARYGDDTVRVRTEAGRAALDGEPGVEAVSDYGNLQEVRLTGRPAALPGPADRADAGPPLRSDPAVAARHLRPHRPAGRGTAGHKIGQEVGSMTSPVPAMVCDHLRSYGVP